MLETYSGKCGCKTDRAGGRRLVPRGWSIELPSFAELLSPNSHRLLVDHLQNPVPGHVSAGNAAEQKSNQLQPLLGTALISASSLSGKSDIIIGNMPDVNEKTRQSSHFAVKHPTIPHLVHKRDAAPNTMSKYLCPNGGKSFCLRCLSGVDSINNSHFGQFDVQFPAVEARCSARIQASG